jgi:Rieske Fe-S protein
VHSSHKDQSSKTARDRSDGGPVQHPGAAASHTSTEMFPWEVASLASEGGYPDEVENIDPFAEWASKAGASASGQRPSARLAKGKSRSHGEPGTPRFGRRKLVTLLVAGTAGVITVVTVGGISFARAPQHTSHVGDDGSISTVPLKERDTDKDGDASGDRDNDGDGNGQHKGKVPHKKPTPTGSPTATQTPSPTKTPVPQPSPTTPPTTTPTPAGKVIGSSTQTANTAVAFTNPADGQASWLVRMSNGSFVAVEGACTHAGVAVKYNASLGQFTCPAHGAIFNADGTNPQSPAKTPLPPVHITVNANGTITTP